MRAIARKLQNKLEDGAIHERCGLVLKRGKVIEVDNVHPRPEHGVLFPVDKLVEHEAELVGTWHTHPSTPSLLSQQDYLGFLQWPNLTHYIVAADGVRAYVVDDGLILEDGFAAR